MEAPNGHKYAPFLAAHLGHLDAYFMDWEGEQKVLLEDGTKLYHGINFPGKYVPVGGSFFSLMVRLEVDASGEGGQPSDAMRIVARSWDRYQQNALAEFAAYRNAQQMERD